MRHGVSAFLAGVVFVFVASAAGGAPTAPGSRLWVARTNGGLDGYATSLATDGARVFVTGSSSGNGTANDYLTAAYDAATGKTLWKSRYNGTGNGGDFATAIAVSPDGTRVFVTGQSRGSTSGGDYATVAYDAATGAQLWAARYDGPAAQSRDAATALVVTPDGARVLVTGGTTSPSTNSDYTTIAYDAATGTQQWLARYTGVTPHGADAANAIGISPDGTRAFVTGVSAGPGVNQQDAATASYDTSTGAQLWAARSDNVGGARGLVVEPDGTRVFVTGGTGSFFTAAYDAATGAELWSRSHGTQGNTDLGFSIAENQAGTRVFVSGNSNGTPNDYVTIAYDSSNGTQLWVKRYPQNCCNEFPTVRVAPDGTRVFVAGTTDKVDPLRDYVTLAYDATTGSKVWSRRYDGPAKKTDVASSLAVAPDGSRLYVTGSSIGTTGRFDFATIAYSP